MRKFSAIVRRVLVACGALFCILNPQLSTPARALIDPYNPALLITDEEFNDAGAMSCEQIQAFLSERKGVLKTYAPDGRSAAQIICDNAARFSVNPRLLLTMMQKEMGLLTDPAPTEGALNWAMGCGPGWPGTKGFVTNVECGARTLRRNFDRPGLGQESVEGVTPANRGTLALYRYTEHVEGNKDFFNIWARYFPNSVASGIPPEIYVDSRDVELAPAIERDPPCLNGWSASQKARGNHALLTPNVATQAESTNNAVWRPNIPREGAYRVFVFIPNRDAAQWACGPIAAKLDTTSARYTIKHRDGVTTYTVNQAPIHDGWVELGSYYFTAGSDNTVRVDDITGEQSNTRWVSIDDMKFVWVQP